MSLAPAADTVLRILVLLARQVEPVPAATVATSLGLPRSTTYRLLGALVEQGFVSYLPEERRYGLGVVTFELGFSYSRQMPLRRIAQPVLSRLASTTSENAHLAVLHGPDVYYVIEQRAPRRRALVSDVGVRLPATVTASGLAILAALPAAQIRAVYPDADALVERAGHGPPDPPAGRLSDSAGAAAPAESPEVSRRRSPAPGARSATARACPRRKR